MPMVILLSSKVPNSAAGGGGGVGPNRFLPLMGVGLLPMLILLVGVLV